MGQRIVFIGVGKMGLPMAQHLATAGHMLRVTDVSAPALAQARGRGLAIVAPGPDLQAALADAEVVISSVPDDAALRAVGAQVAESANAAAIWVDTSTVSPAVSAAVAREVEAVGIAHVRCTVSGNNHMAQAARLTVMASGPRSAWERVQPLLACWGPRQFHLGEGEQARLMKLVVNLMIAQTSAMLSEALTLGERGGLDWSVMWDVLCASAVGSPIVQAKATQLRERDYTPTFTVPQMLKDVDLILQEAQRLGVPLEQTSITRQWMLEAIAAGWSDDDYASIIRVQQSRAAGRRVRSPSRRRRSPGSGRS